MLSCILAILSSAAAKAVQLDSGASFDMRYLKGTQELEIKAAVPKNTYLAIGYGDLMKNTDMVIFQAKGAKGEVNDLWSQGHARTYKD